MRFTERLTLTDEMRRQNIYLPKIKHRVGRLMWWYKHYAEKKSVIEQRKSTKQLEILPGCLCLFRRFCLGDGCY